MTRAGCPVCACTRPGATRTHAIAAALRDDDLDRALSLGLMDADTCTGCSTDCRESLAAARDARTRAFEARERYRQREMRLRRLDAERDAGRALPSSRAATSVAATALPDAAAAALARAKARAAQRKPR